MRRYVRRFYEETFVRGNLDSFDQLVAAEYVHHDDPCAPTDSPEQYKEWISGVRELFPDLELTIDDVIAEGDQVVVRGTLCATHTKEFWGLAPTGRKWTTRWINIFRVADGKIVEGWINQDRMGLQLQIEGKV